MADQTQRGQWASLGWLALMDFSTADSQGNAYDYTKPSKTPPILMGARHGWTTTASGFIIPQTQLDSDKSTCGPVGGWLCYPPAGSRTQPQWGPSPFLVQVQSVSPLQVAVVQRSDGTLSADLSQVFNCTLMPGAPTPVLNDMGILVQPSRLDSQDPIFVPTKGSSTNVFPAKITVGLGGGSYTVQQTVGLGPGTSYSTPTNIQTALESTLSTYVPTGTPVLVYSGLGDANYYFVYPLGTC